MRLMKRLILSAVVFAVSLLQAAEMPTATYIGTEISCSQGGYEAGIVSRVAPQVERDAKAAERAAVRLVVAVALRNVAVQLRETAFE